MDDELMTETNGWDQYQKLVIDKLGEHDEKFTSIESKLMKIQVDLATLKVKAGVWGGLAGMIPVVIAIVMFYATQTEVK
jgi:hypothetical protein